MSNLAEQQDVIIEVKNVRKSFNVKKNLFSLKQKQLKAVDDVSFKVYKGETLGIVGESGSGKSTLGRLILNLLDNSSGDILFEGNSIANVSDKKFRKYRSQLQMIFQDPYSSLNPWMTVKELIAEPILLHKYISEPRIEGRVIELLEKVGLSAADLHKHPHEFSGGQRQRICIARALALNPKFIVCDEPVSALDVSIQSQIINLLSDLQKELNLTYLFISHNFSVIRNIADRVAVMYLGKIIEISPVEELFDHPVHPYTQSLLSSVLSIDPDVKRARIKLKGDIPSPTDVPSGCRFHTRCEFSTETCREVEPQLRDLGNEHYVACHIPDYII